jgi:hypothetical protein
MAALATVMPAALRRTGDVIFAEWSRECVRSMPGSAPGTFGAAVDQLELANRIATRAATVTIAADAASGPMV